jgi:hypothetical protein
MAISILFNPMPVRLFEADGDFAAGAKAYFYLARTTTPLTVYTDAPMTTAHTWPVVADAYGLLPPIYIEKGEEYKVRIEDALGSILYAADGISNPLDVTTEGGGEPGIVVTADEIFQVGDVMWNPASGPRAGWARCNGRTISKAAGAGTESNNDDCHDLFLFLWNNFPDSICPVTPGGRGGSAEADWGVAKAIATLDMRGRSAVGLDDMGNTAANLIQVATTINTTNASTAATVASTEGLAAGMFVIAAGIMAGTKIASVNSATAITLSANATATASGVAARFSIFSDAQTPGAAGGENTHKLLLTEGSAKESYADYSGTNYAIFAVPTWATGAVVTAAIMATTGAYLAVQFSGDGTTFLAGASDYAFGAGWHAVTPAAFNTVPVNTTTYLQLSLSGDSFTLPHLVQAEISLTRSTTAEGFMARGYSTTYHSTQGLVTGWYQGYCNPAATPSLTVKALKFFGPTGKAGSFIHIKWIGAAEPVALSNALPAPPLLLGNGDGEEGETLPAGVSVMQGSEPALYEPATTATGSSMAMNLHTPARLGTWFCKK